MFDIGPGPVERISIWPAVPVALLAIKIDYSVLVRSQTKRNTVFISAVDDMPQQTDNDQFVNEKGPDVIEDIRFEICRKMSLMNSKLNELEFVFTPSRTSLI